MPDLRDSLNEIPPAKQENGDGGADKASTAQSGRSKMLGCGCLVVIVFCIATFFIHIGHNTPEATSIAAPSSPGWEYEQINDKLHGARWVEAKISSANTVDFDFPYQGGSSAWIKLSTHGEVTLGVSKGQFNCQGTTALYPIHIKIDEEAPKAFGCYTSSEMKPNEVEITDGAAIIKAINDRHHLIVQAPFFQAGDKQFEFNIPAAAW